MRTLRVIVFLLLVTALAVNSIPATAGDKIDLGLDILSQNDGWAASGPGVTGGSAAAPEQVYVVTNRLELVTALNNGVYPPSSNPSDTPKIIYVSGVINANVDDDNQPLTCEDYYRNGFTWEDFLTAYDPVVYGRIAPSGSVEAGRLASRDAQQARVRIRVGSNTTIVGLGTDATIRGAWFDIRGSRNTAGVQIPRRNIIIRNLTFEDTYDCFPEWSPNDGTLGSWNALYDAISLRESVNVWVDHNTFRDRETLDKYAPTYFGVLFQQHDGLLDITNASDLVTVSWNRFENHDKVMLIGSSDSGTTAERDRGRLRVTLHHNLFSGVGQRTPRVRFGQVHIYNNYYKIINNPTYVYTWGVGKESQIYAENNNIKTDQKIEAANLIGVYQGINLFETGTAINGTPGNAFVDVVSDYNAEFNPDLTNLDIWTPALFLPIDSTQRVIPLVESQSGPFNW